MANLKENAAVWGVGGIVIFGIINLGLFAPKSDVSDLRAEMYREFVTRQEYTTTLQEVNKKLDLLVKLVYEGKK